MKTHCHATGKRRFPNYQAVMWAKARVSVGTRTRQGTAMRVYLCPACNGWHLTSDVTRAGKRPRMPEKAS